MRGVTLKLLKTLEGSYSPAPEEIPALAEASRLNKLYLAFLRRVGGVELQREEARFRRFMENAAEVATSLRGLDYAFFKFSRPFDHVSVDLDVLVRRDHLGEAVGRLLRRNFKIVVAEPYTVTLERDGFVVDLYTHPSFAWLVYMDGGRLLEYAEDGEVWGAQARLLSRPAEVVVAAAHAVYKEHIYLLMDYFVVRRWLDKRVVRLAEELELGYALSVAEALNDAIDSGAVEAPYKLPAGLTAVALAERFTRFPAFRGTGLNLIKLIVTRRAPRLLVNRLRRRSY